MDILNPPQSYIDWRCYVHGWKANPQNTKEQFDSLRRKFYGMKEYEDCEEEILAFCRWLHGARESLSLPVERVEVYEGGRAIGKSVRMMIYDIDYWRERGMLRSRKKYVPLEKSYDPVAPTWFKHKKDQKIISSGDREPGEEG